MDRQQKYSGGGGGRAEDLKRTPRNPSSDELRQEDERETAGEQCDEMIGTCQQMRGTCLGDAVPGMCRGGERQHQREERRTGE